MRRAAFRCCLVDGEWIFRRPDTFGKSGLPLHRGEVQVAAFSMEGCPETERREQISRDRRFRVAVPMHPGPLVDIPNQSEFYWSIRLRPVEKGSRQQAEGVVASGSGSRRNFLRRLI